tara:strand:- start:27 stop:1337 length:1311 start_codon:yes stop_codon:yes gene_type:complete
MKLPKIFQMTIREFRKKFPESKVVRCKKFNRRKCWELLDFKRWFSSIRKGANINPLIYIDIQSCMEYCRVKGLNRDYLYYKHYADEDYDYITIEGGNRHDGTHMFYTDESQNRDDKHVNYCVIKGVDRKTMHDLYCRLAYGKSPNRQEQRTGIFGISSDLVRKTSEKLSHVWNKVKGINTNRMQDDEMVATIMLYVTEGGTFGKSDGGNKDDNLDTLYRNNKWNKGKFTYMWKELVKVFDSIIDYDNITKKLEKSFLYCITIILDTLHTKYNIENYDDFVKEVYEIWITKWKDDSIVHQRKNQPLSFSGMMSGMATYLEQVEKLKSIINEDIIPELEEEKIITPRNEEEFTYLHRKQYIEKNKFKKGKKWYVKIRSNNDAKTLLKNTQVFKDVLLSEAYSAKCELDHIEPKTKGGKTILENAELTTKQYNRKKSNK